MMATMSSAFTTANRRKRIATYGKSSRTATTFAWNEDAPSPERPRKQAGVLNGTLKSPAGIPKAGGALASTYTSVENSPASRDIFDVLSDAEVGPADSPVLAKPRSKPVATVDEFDVPVSDDEPSPPPRRTGKPLQPSRKPEPVRRPISIPKAQRKPDKVPHLSADGPLTPPRRRARTPQPEQKADNGESNKVLAAKRPAARPKPKPRRTTPATAGSATQKKSESASTLLSKDPVLRALSDVDVFDVPPSDEDAPIFTPRRPSSALVSQAGPSNMIRALSARPSPSPSPTESDGSNTSRKRKRQESSQSSVAGDGSSGPSIMKESSFSLRRKKYQRKEASVSPGHEMTTFTSSTRVANISPQDPVINKPKRTRIRTIGLARQSIAKGLSSPAKLHSMLAVRPSSKPIPAPELPEIVAFEDETMYDIPDPSTPVTRPTLPTIEESVTPRQTQMFNNLLGESTEAITPGMPNIRSLQLTDRKPASLLGGLTRSSSDIPQTTLSRKKRLVDRLMQAAPSSEEEASESDGETEEDIVEIPVKSAPTPRKIFGKAVPNNDASDDMTIDSQNQSNSQASQNTLSVNVSTKVTYAKQRSYVSESNIEDGLLSMDFDDAFGFEPNKGQGAISDDEDDPASQVRGIHELRRQGQNQKFQMEAQTAIDDIADKAGLGKSVRRSAMLDFCSRMADPQFMEQLLQSALAHQFLASIGSTGEVIFDFAASVAVAFILKAGPGSNVLDEIHASDIMTTLARLLDVDSDINRIAKDRKTNMSKVGRESVDNFRSLAQKSSIWSQDNPSKVSPQIVALRTMELLVLAFRKAGSTEALISENVICKLLDLASGPCERFKVGKALAQDLMVLNIMFSIMEAVSISKEKQATWSNDILQRLVKLMPVFFGASSASPVKLVIRLCILLTNNKPKACELFAGPKFVKPLVESISHGFTQLASDLADEEKMELRESLILSLGAMINIAEFSDDARANVASNGDELVDALAKTFLEGSERAAQVCSYLHLVTEPFR